jgi:hypothetical protein
VEKQPLRGVSPWCCLFSLRGDPTRRRQRRSRPPDELIGFVDVRIGPPIDTFGGAGGEGKARLFEVFGYAFLAHKPK